MNDSTYARLSPFNRRGLVERGMGPLNSPPAAPKARPYVQEVVMYRCPECRELHQAPGRGNARPRCDGLEARVDGVVVASGGINAINRHAAQCMVPRAMSRRAVAGMQTQWTARDEADAAAV